MFNFNSSFLESLLHVAIIVRSEVATIAIIVRSEVATIAIIVKLLKFLFLQYLVNTNRASIVVDWTRIVQTAEYRVENILFPHLKCLKSYFCGNMAPAPIA